VDEKGEDEPAFAEVKVFYATDRSISDVRKRSGDRYGTDRNLTEKGSITYGICKVSIPRTHRTGVLEGPSIWRFEFSKDPQKHIVLLDVEAYEKPDFYARIAENVRNSRGRNALIFIHGYRGKCILDIP
jgi:esterase/lipase superfamily enzyme